MTGWGRFVGMLLAFAISTDPAHALAPPDIAKLEADVLAALNAARTGPQAYAAGLGQYRGFYHANLVVIPGIATRFQTEEGVVPVDEAIAFLGGRGGLATLEQATLLSETAREHVLDQQVSGQVGHYGSDGSTPSERAVRHGGGRSVAEVIAYGASDAADVIRQLIIDDGVADRGHRILMFSDHLRYAGVACGTHPQFRTMCVIDMADTPDGQGRSPVRIAQRDSDPKRRK